jgi:hypothetical protein
MPTEELRRWREDLTDTGHKRLLNENMPETLSEKYGLPPEFFRQEKIRLCDRPTFDPSSEIQRLDATPTKRAIRNKADNCPVDLGITVK